MTFLGNMLRCLVLLALTPAHALRPKAINLLSRIDNGFVKEAEFKHARVALLSLPALAALSAAGADEPVKWLSQQSFDTQASFFADTGVIEAFSLARLGSRFSLKDGLEPGNVLRLSNVSNSFVDCELYAGRAAMLGAAYVIASGM